MTTLGLLRLQPGRRRLAILFIMVLELLAFQTGRCAGPDMAYAWNPATPLPKFLTHHYVEPQYLTAISKYRSGIGRPFSDDYEKSDRSLKNYFEARRTLLGKNNTVPVFAPASGTLTAISPVGHILSDGTPRGSQLTLIPDGFPGFNIELSFVVLQAGLTAGSHVAAGDPLGYVDLREAVDFDWSVSTGWTAVPLYDGGKPNDALKSPGFRLVSPFDLMDDATFASYAAYGITDRGAFVVPVDFRDANPGRFGNGNLAQFDPVEFVVLRPSDGPVIDRAPAGQNLAVGGALNLSVSASLYLASSLGYQWRKDGTPLPGQTGQSLFIESARVSDMGFYSAVVTGGGTSTESAIAIVTVHDSTTSRILNSSARGVVPTGGALTLGFVLRGAGVKPAVVRGVGPALGSLFGFAGALLDPKIEVIASPGATVLITNEDWSPTPELVAATAASGAFPLPLGSRDAAVLARLPSNGSSGYTLRVSSSSSAASGIALAEIYDPEPPVAPTRLGNVSVLGFSGTDAESLTAGWVIEGTAPKHVLVRAVGPGLAAFGVSNRLADPQLTIISAAKSLTIASNNDWGDGDLVAELATRFGSVQAFLLPDGSKDAALSLWLPPGGYTARVSGGNGATGMVLVEIYDLQL